MNNDNADSYWSNSTFHKDDPSLLEAEPAIEMPLQYMSPGREKRRTPRRKWFLVLFILLVLIGAGIFTYTRLIIVSNLNDSGPGSLRFALALALPGSTITFAPNLKGEIVLNSPIDIANSLTIDGPGANILSVRSQASLFHVQDGITVTISGLTFANGSSTAAVEGSQLYESPIMNDGTLTLNHVTLANNTATGNESFGGALYNEGTLTLLECSVINNSAGGNGNDGYGGAIYNSDEMTLTNDVFTANHATGKVAFGGAIYNSSSAVMTVTSSRFRNNNASGTDGAFGGGIDNSGGTLTLINSSITSNTATGSVAYGGGLDYWGALKLVHTSIVGNSAGGKLSQGNNIYNQNS